MERDDDHYLIQISELKAALRIERRKRMAVRKAVSDYMNSEGCSCCRDTDAHDKNKKVLAELLSVPMYGDKSGYDFSKFRTQEPRKVKRG